MYIIINQIISEREVGYKHKTKIKYEKSKTKQQEGSGQVSGGQIHTSLLRTQLPMVRNKHTKITIFSGLLYFL